MKKAGEQQWPMADGTWPIITARRLPELPFAICHLPFAIDHLRSIIERL
jgi:hypothetical protein